MQHNLIHIGYRKAASTFLRDWFYFHPALKLQSVDSIAELSHPTDGFQYFVYSEAFLLFKANDRPRNIENLQKFQREKCEELKQKLNGSKILLITRAPEQCVFSEYSEFIKNGGFKSYNEMKDDALAQEYFIGYYNINFVIELYEQAFGKENMIVLPMELLEEDPHQFVVQLEKSLKIEHFDFQYHKRNPSRSPKQLWAFRKISLFVWRCTAIFGKYRKGLYYLYVKYLEKESYKNKKLSIPITILSVFKWKSVEEMHVPETLLKQMKQNNTILRNYPLFENFSNKYFN
jgi:hypothetical protein